TILFIQRKQNHAKVRRLLKRIKIGAEEVAVEGKAVAVKTVNKTAAKGGVELGDRLTSWTPLPKPV
ncbi:MAG: hypothetical protein QF454_03660, partial [Candidatus Thalassarchaeaceae archaeon]|nr:hypothetical protein [Candidatus Thalassarchaeaceae archaeon]